MTGCAGSIGSRRPLAVSTQPVPVALPVQRRLGAGLLDEGDVRAVADRGSVDLEGGELDRVAGALVVVGEAAGGAPISYSPASIATISGPLGALRPRCGRNCVRCDLGGSS